MRPALLWGWPPGSCWRAPAPQGLSHLHRRVQTHVNVIIFLLSPDKLFRSRLVILFFDKMSLTSRVMLVKAPGWMSEMRLLDMLTDSSLGWVLRTRGVRESGRQTHYYNSNCWVIFQRFYSCRCFCLFPQQMKA